MCHSQLKKKSLQSSGLRNLVAYLAITVVSHEPATPKSGAVFGNHPPDGVMTNNSTSTHPQTTVFFTTTKYFSNCVHINASVNRSRPNFFFFQEHVILFINACMALG
jgi:hypothetical protein